MATEGHRPTYHRSRPRRRPGGFSLLELLVAIGVILVLMGIAVVGFNAFDRGASEKQTRVTMENLRGMLAAYERQVGRGGMDKLSEFYSPANGDPYNAGPNTPYQMRAPGDINPGSADRAAFEDPNHTNYGKLATRKAMQQLVRVPENANALKQLPERSLLRVKPGSTPVPPQGTLIVLDAWENPILFVPAGGMLGVKNEEGQVLAPPDHIRAPGDRPFFASAGSDGDFTTNSDNIYSFQN